jgi:DnaJ domain
MNTRQQNLLVDLIGKYSTHGTESLVAYVAETNGMLDACKTLIQSISDGGSNSFEWLQEKCAALEVSPRPFLKEVENIVVLFVPNCLKEDHYAVLGLPVTADLEEIKKAYRTLSRTYHPDTASSDNTENTTTFIAISKAYQALMHQHTLGGPSEEPKTMDWRRKKVSKVSTTQKRQLFLWTSGLVLLLVVVSTIATINMQRKAMLAGLRESRGAFIPPAKNTPTDKKEKNQEKPAVFVAAPDPPQALPSTAPVADVTSVVLAPTEPQHQRLNNTNTAVPSDTEPPRKVSKTEKKTKEQHAKTTEIQTSVATAQQHAEIAPSPPIRPPVAQQSEPEAEKQPLPPEVAKHSEPVLVAKATVEPAAPAPEIIPPQQQPQGMATSFASVASATVSEISPPSSSTIAPKPDPQARVDRFLADYITIYEQRNLILFSRFFQGNAKENGKAFASVMPVYLDLFGSTSHISFTLEQHSYRFDGDRIFVDCLFKVFLKYTNGRERSGSGPIQFQLSTTGDKLLIEEMNYTFHSE